ncbi:hypothetical protein, variant [Coccidioides immitis RS]|uniref:Uncharacterized protein n=3 Tax=Coccidioides immitis TaxID=5501 RepID=J0HG12_COCIM|nr:uncharacterized protein CIMG_07704 [Coccidioides immitis RS]XP_004445172.1 hypothetical protein, variant [Coccidioides immitis RS]KMP06084.1 hypothetical protein CIRG_05765 [Coccidioides immitis RMSCC 2394]TPX22867.1 hypothetical protein DIZ76_014747 [Coccidioides immitis]KJF60907.1 hypothetical protein CIMG_07704 [Coccidioides immitis RS]KJF60908.1 hypothetical protein, variant [Coccidioides immitis RS]
MPIDYLGKIGDGSGVLTSRRQRMKPIRSQSSGNFLDQDDVRAGPGRFSSSLPSLKDASNPSPSKYSTRSYRSPSSTDSAQAEMTLASGYRPDMLDKKARSKHKVHILPHLKKDRSTSLDLNLTAVENEGLGIYTNLDRDQRYGDAYVTATRLAGSNSHQRSISGNSQGSVTMTMSASNKPGSHYVHPMRQTPRPRTPVNRSHQNSITDNSPDTHQFPDLDGQATSSNREPPRQSSSLNSNMESRPSFNIHRENLTFPHAASQTNVGRASSSFSRQMDNNSARETISPISRSSLEFPFRSKSRPSTTDPVARAAAVQAARQAFEDREAAKSRKHEQRNMKAQDKELRREQKEQHEGSGRTPRLTDFTFRNHRNSEKAAHHEGSAHGDSGYYSSSGARYGGEGGTKFGFKSPKTAWLLFLTWLRTRIFKMGKKIKKMS